MHSAAWSRAARPSGPGGGRLIAARTATNGAGDCCSNCAAAFAFAASNAEKPARPLAFSPQSLDWRKGSSTRRPTSAKSTSCAFGRSVSASNAKAAAMRLCTGCAQEQPRADSRHFRSPPVGIRGLPSFPNLRRASSILAKAIMPACGTFTSPSSVNARASWIASSASVSSGSCVYPRMSARYRVGFACPRHCSRNAPISKQLYSFLRTSPTAVATGSGPLVLARCRVPSSSSSFASCPDAMVNSIAMAASRTSRGVSALDAFSRRRSTAPALSSEPVQPRCTQRDLSFEHASTTSLELAA
mmetsp:Transcript_9284/g.27450  ORF Transcript_9284/g.27450 Transcript_9284/m.27450 type:complete len:301 (+) Transcript_9284:51-953(+)